MLNQLSRLIMDSKKIRKSFIKFFEDKDHIFVPSSPVVPLDDPTLLFTNAGMNQFKPIFLEEKSLDNLRAVNSQKCIRVSGKHNDLEEVGVDTFHHTFFEMLGNWSFGDYYKPEAIEWAWDLLTNVWGLDKRRLWVTVYHEDNESFDLWPKLTDINPARVLKCGKKDNFWEMGDLGPCGPCSEIHYYIGGDLNQQTSDGVNKSDQYWELWNLVFIQNNRLINGKLSDLPSKHVDTGAGFERIASVLQGKLNNYSTDLFQPIIKKCENLTGNSSKITPVPFQVIADHVRMLTFAIADGCMPGNEGRGYVLRRILRRASRFGRVLNQKEPFLYQLVPDVGEIMGEIFPEIVERRLHIEKIILSEENAFKETLTRGLVHFEKLLSNTVSGQIVGKEAFRLYDTYGFPLDLTQQMAKEKNLSVDIEGFKKEMKAQKIKAKQSAKFESIENKINWISISDNDNSKFIGYDTTNSEAFVMRYAYQDDNILLILDETPFYAQSGGQIGDRGKISNKEINLEVVDVKNQNDEFIHICKGKFKEENLKKIFCEVDYDRRQKTRKNHTATHLMHKALKIVLGDHVQQAGSLVHPDYLRFDLTHFEKISSEQIQKIESIVNYEILSNSMLDVSIQPYDQAKKEGAVAMFGEKYGDEVRVVTVGDFSKELCGGTHVERTGDIGLFKIIEESSLAAGVRRIVAITGPESLSYMQNLYYSVEDLRSLLGCSKDEIILRIKKLISEKKELEKEIKNSRSENLNENIDSFISSSKKIGKHSIIIQMTALKSINELKDLGNIIINKINSGIIVLGAMGDKPTLLIGLTGKLVEDGLNAGKIAKELGVKMGGGGGGRPNIATAGGKNLEGLELVLDESFDYLKTLLKK